MKTKRQWTTEFIDGIKTKVFAIIRDGSNRGRWVNKRLIHREMGIKDANVEDERKAVWAICNALNALRFSGMIGWTIDGDGHTYFPLAT